MRTFDFKFFLFLIFILSGCRKDQWNDCFQSTGEDKTEVRLEGSFTKILIGENFDILLTQDTGKNEEIKITAGSKIIGQIITKVKNGVLTIENKNICNFVRSYNRKIKIEIRVKYLDDIEIFSASNLYSQDTLDFRKTDYLKLKNFGLGDVNLKLRLGFLDIRSYNSGNIILEGFSNIVSCSIEEVTQLHALHLECDDLYIDSHTPLDCFVNPRIRLSVNLFKDGNIFFKTEPSKIKEVNIQRGKGRLIKL